MLRLFFWNHVNLFFDGQSNYLTADSCRPEPHPGDTRRPSLPVGPREPSHERQRYHPPKSRSTSRSPAYKATRQPSATRFPEKATANCVPTDAPTTSKRETSPVRLTVHKIGVSQVCPRPNQVVRHGLRPDHSSPLFGSYLVRELPLFIILFTLITAKPLATFRIRHLCLHFSSFLYSLSSLPVMRSSRSAVFMC